MDNNTDYILGRFVWNIKKELTNINKHGVDFYTAIKAFDDSDRKIYIDSNHCKPEKRLFCVGKVGKRILTVRFTYRKGMIRIFGAGYWRKGVKYYEEKD